MIWKINSFKFINTKLNTFQTEVPHEVTYTFQKQIGWFTYTYTCMLAYVSTWVHALTQWRHLCLSCMLELFLLGHQLFKPWFMFSVKYFSVLRELLFGIFQTFVSVYWNCINKCRPSHVHTPFPAIWVWSRYDFAQNPLISGVFLTAL